VGTLGEVPSTSSITDDSGRFREMGSDLVLSSRAGAEGTVKVETAGPTSGCLVWVVGAAADEAPAAARFHSERVLLDASTATDGVELVGVSST